MELVINSFGVSLNRDNEAFVVTTNEGRQRIPAESVTSIQISRGAQVTSDAVLLAIERQIEMLFVNRSGDPVGRVWSPSYGSISTIRKGQLNFCFSHEAVAWIKKLIARKIDNQQALMLILTGNNEQLQNEVTRNRRRLDDYRDKVLALDGELVNDIAPTLRGWEGQASRIYFATINLALPEHLRFETRSQHPALDVTNAFLNYGYGVLYGRVEGALIKAGLDPYIGILHRDDYNRPVLAYDVIEIFRVWVDYVVYNLLAHNAVTDEFYSIREDGSYWLEALGRRILIQSLNDYLDEVVDINGLQRSRITHLNLYAQDFAQKLKNFLPS